MRDDHSPTHVDARFAVRFFLVTAGVLIASTALAWALSRFASALVPGQGLPLVFAVSTPLLLAASAALHSALAAVRAERQQQFRRRLRTALICGMLFLGVQGHGLRKLLSQLAPEEAQTGAVSFAFVFAALHALHVGVAMLFLVFVTLQAHNNRYDHEYSWGVAVCTYFWHVLGVVWLCILAVFAMATA